MAHKTRDGVVGEEGEERERERAQGRTPQWHFMRAVEHADADAVHTLLGHPDVDPLAGRMYALVTAEDLRRVWEARMRRCEDAARREMCAERASRYEEIRVMIMEECAVTEEEVLNVRLREMALRRKHEEEEAAAARATLSSYVSSGVYAARYGVGMALSYLGAAAMRAAQVVTPSSSFSSAASSASMSRS